jgi:hypothetical protein
MSFRLEEVELLRLLRAFEKIGDRQRRLEIIKLVEDCSSDKPPRLSPNTKKPVVHGA